MNNSESIAETKGHSQSDTKRETDRPNGQQKYAVRGVIWVGMKDAPNWGDERRKNHNTKRIHGWMDEDEWYGRLVVWSGHPSQVTREK